MKPLVIAHRTCPRDAAENSLAGISKATELGADVVEIDVRLSSDGEPMLMHDRWLLRTTGWPLRLDWVRRSIVTRMRLNRSGGERVPSLAEGLAALAPTMKVAIDVKDPGAADAVISEVRNQSLEARVLFWSRHETAVREAATSAPELEVSLLRDTDEPDELEQFLADTTAFGARGISAKWSQVTPALAERCVRDQIKLYAWCRTESIDTRKLALLDGVVTDWPEAATAAIDELPG